MGKMQKYLAEAMGTFALVGVGSFAIVSASAGDSLGIVSIALGFGLALLIGLYAFGEVSGGHFNPAVSLAMFLDRRITMDDLIGYVVSQFVGAIAAALVVLIAFNDDAVAGTTTQSGDNWAGIVVEFVFAALFVAVILQSSKSERVRGSALIAIPLALVAIHVAAIPISGASVNPARSFGPALIGTEFTDLWIYLIVPPLGAIVGWIVYKVVMRGRHEPAGRLRRRPPSARHRHDDHASHRRAGASASDRLVLDCGGVRCSGRPRGTTEQRLDPLDLPEEVVLLGHGAGGGVRAWEDGGRAERRGERRLVARVDEHPGPRRDELGWSPDRRRHDRAPGGEPFERCEPERLDEARLTDDVGRAKPARHHRVGLRPRERDAGDALEFRSEGAVADEDERSLTAPHEGPREPHDVLSLAQRAGAEECRSRRVPPERFPRRRGVTRREALEIDPAVDHLRAPTRLRHRPFQPRAKPGRDRDDGRRAPHGEPCRRAHQT